jgi:4-phospho-D-threonate 3-dehydrogenase / 4-phospho-D-erythronate 3-dehydrogenase
LLKAIVAVTMGDPAGVGPEVVLKALSHRAVRKVCSPVIVGDWKVLQRARGRNKGFPRLVDFRPGQTRTTLNNGGAAIPVCSLSSLPAAQSRPGSPSKEGGRAAYRYIEFATRLALSRAVDAIATAPISKSILKLAGYNYPGHTELLAELSRTRECRMMLLGRGLRVILVTGHIPFVQVSPRLTRRGIRATLELAHEALRNWFGIRSPRIAVAALNPHGGEEGIFGSEEKRWILPAVQAAKARGIRAYGPFPADSLFYQAVAGQYDAVVCMYHDQGLIPLKLHHFFGGVALTLGLPFIRTSVDHGTAYAIAGKGKADASSMKEAILLAAKLARQTSKRSIS